MTEAIFEEQLTIKTPEDMHALGIAVGQELCVGDVLLLTGALGAGKTTLTRGIGEGMNVRGPVTSPTFVLARTHPSLVGGAPLVHVDAYRLTDPRELDDLDLDFEHSAVVIEWGEGMLDPGTHHLAMTLVRQTGADPIEGEEFVEERTALIKGYGFRWAEGLPL